MIKGSVLIHLSITASYMNCPWVNNHWYVACKLERLCHRFYLLRVHFDMDVSLMSADGTGIVRRLISIIIGFLPRLARETPLNGCCGIPMESLFASFNEI